MQLVDVGLSGYFKCLPATLLMAVFAGRLYQWEVRLMYGRVLDRLKETIAEMEDLSA